MHGYSAPATAILFKRTPRQLSFRIAIRDGVPRAYLYHFLSGGRKER